MSKGDKQKKRLQKNDLAFNMPVTFFFLGLILFIAGLLPNFTPEVKNSLTILALLTAGYHVIWEGVEDTVEQSKKANCFVPNTHILMALAALGAVLLGETTEAALLIFVFAEQINFSQKLDKTTNLHIEQGNKDYFLLPFTGEMLSAKYYEAVRCALAEIEKCQMTFDDRVGCYFKYDDQQVNSFIAIKIKECQEDKTNFLSLCLNHRHIHAQHLTKDRIQPKIKELHQKESINEFLILETFESPYQLSQPHLEMQYVVDNKR